MMNRLISQIVLYSIVLSILFISCAERKRTNIFDPSYPKPTIDVGLDAIGSNSSIKLEWSPAEITPVKSILLYKKQQRQTQFSMLAELPANAITYTDTSVRDDTPYEYYLIFRGDDRISAPSATVSAITGPGSIWVLDIYSYEIQHFSYDLKQRDLRILGIWQPQALAIDSANQVGLVTYPDFRTYELLDLASGRSLASSDSKNAPLDGVYNDSQKEFWLLDSTSGLYAISVDDIIGSRVDVRLKHPSQIVKLGLRYYIIDSGGRRIIALDSIGGIQDSITKRPDGSFFENITLLRTDKFNTKLYFREDRQRHSNLYRYDLSNGAVSSVYNDTTIYAFDIDGVVHPSIWIIKPGKLNSSLVQLSLSGLRLQTQDGFTRPTDIRVNPANGNIILTDAGSGKIYHYRPDLSLIGIFQSDGQPFKVYLE